MENSFKILVFYATIANSTLEADPMNSRLLTNFLQSWTCCPARLRPTLDFRFERKRSRSSV